MLARVRIHCSPPRAATPPARAAARALPPHAAPGQHLPPFLPPTARPPDRPTARAAGFSHHVQPHHAHAQGVLARRHR